MPLVLTTAGDLATIYRTASALNADLLEQVDTSQFQTALLQLSGTFSGTVTFQGSLEDVPTNWISLTAMNVTTGAVASTANAGGLYYIPLTCKWFRIRVTSYSSGTLSGATMFSYDEVPFIEAGNTIVSGTVAISGNPVLGTGANSIGAIAASTSPTSALSQVRIVGAASGVIKASAGRRFGHTVGNSTASWRYLQFYNKATAGIPGTDTPVATLAIPPNAIADETTTIGIYQATGIAWAVTTDAAGTTIATAGDVNGTAYFA